MTATDFTKMTNELIEKRNILIQEHKSLKKDLEMNEATFTTLLEEGQSTSDEAKYNELQEQAEIIQRAHGELLSRAGHVGQAIRNLTNAINALAGDTLVEMYWG